MKQNSCTIGFMYLFFNINATRDPMLSQKNFYATDYNAFNCRELDN